MKTKEAKLQPSSGQKAESKPFAGRPALVDGLIGGQMPGRSWKEEQVFAALVVKESVMLHLEAAGKRDEFKVLINSHAKSICGKREDAHLDLEAPRPASRPRNVSEALEHALLRMGVRGTITSCKHGAGSSVFGVLIGNEVYRVPLRDSIMEKADPAAEAQSIARMVSIGHGKDERRNEMLRQRRDSRPPTDALQIDKSQLERRMMTYDGRIFDSSSMFTYLAEGMETSISAPAELCGERLLEYLDGWIVSAHSNFKRPLDATVLRAISGGVAAPEDGDAMVRAVADALMFVVCDARFSKCMVPGEYSEAFGELRGSRLYSDFISIEREGPLTAEEELAFDAALRELHNAKEICGKALGIIREAHAMAGGGDGPEVIRMLEGIRNFATGSCGDSVV